MEGSERIYKFIYELAEQWLKVPSLRFGQLMENLRSTYGDMFYFEDDQFIDKIRSYVDNTKIK